MHHQDHSQIPMKDSNINIDLDPILSNNYNQQKLKLDDILESIKNIKNNFNIGEELRSAIKLMKRMKLNECCKW